MKLVKNTLVPAVRAIGAAMALLAGAAHAAEFKEYVDFVETTGSQYVILDYTPKFNTVVTAKVDVRDVSNNSSTIFCARDKENGTTAHSFTLFYLKGADGWRFDYYAYKSSYVTMVTATPGAPVTLTAGGGVFAVDGVTKKTYTAVDFTARNPMMLFGSYEVAPGALTPSAVKSNLARVRLYSLTATEDGVTVLDLKPFVDTDGKFGLYDTVAKKPWYSQGSAEFTGGITSEVTLTDDPAVIRAVTYTEPISGTGDNELALVGPNMLTVEAGIKDFGSVEFRNAPVKYTGTNGAFVDGDNVFLNRGSATWSPKAIGWVNYSCDLAANGSVIYGPSAEIKLDWPSTGGVLRYNIGELSRSAGGTLMFTLLYNHIGSDWLGNHMKFFPKGCEDGELLPPSVVAGRVNKLEESNVVFVKYDAEKGILPADTVAGLEGGADSVAFVNANASIADDTTVGRLEMDCGSTGAQITIPADKKLSIADQGIAIVSRKSSEVEPFAGGGTVDFGDKEGFVWGVNWSKNYIRFNGSGISFTGTKGVTFASRGYTFGSYFTPFEFPNSGTFARWTGPTRIIGCHYYMKGMNSIPHAADSGDIYIEGGQDFGASLAVPDGFEFKNHVHLAGVGTGGDNGKFCAVWSDGQYTFNGPVTLEDYATIHINNRWTPVAFNKPIDGPGGIGVRSNGSGATGYASFTVTNTYKGITKVYNGGSIYVGANATLGEGPVQMPMGRVFFNGRKNYVFNNTVSGPDKGELRFIEAAQVGFSKPVDVASIGTVKIDGSDVSAGIMEFSDSVRFGGIGNAHFATVRATAPGAKLEFTGSMDYTADTDVTVDEGASIAFAKTGANTVTLSGADEFATVDVKEGTLAFEDGSGILDDTESISFWLDADDEDTLTYDPETTYVTEWRSKVGEAVFKADKAGGSRYPRYGYEINGRKAVTFAADTSQTYRERLSDFDHTLALRTTFVVARCTRYSSQDWTAILGRTTTGDGDVSPALRLSTGSKAIRAAGLAQGAGFLRINGRQFCESLYPWALNETTVITAEMTANSSGNVAIGGYHANRDFIGQICEVIEFNRQLTNAERKYVEKYLADKWGVADVSGDGAALGKSTAVTVAAGATLDLNGHSAVVDTLDGTGAIVNTSGKKVTLKVRNTSLFRGTVGDDVELKLKGGLMLFVR